ncbi:MAG: CoA-binding protein [Phycisphaera sp.]|nr:CoA-binding protein [Phycisphaera sp.]
MDIHQQIKAFLAGKTFAVAGASRDRSKYGNRVLRAYMQNNLDAYPINPTAADIEGLAAYPDVASLPIVPDGLSIVTPPPVTRKVVEQAVVKGIGRIWMQPGAEDEEAIRTAIQAGVDVISGGPCVLVALGYHGD